MKPTFGTKLTADWNGAGEYLTITIDLDNPECDAAKAGAVAAAVAGGAVEWLREHGKLGNLAAAITDLVIGEIARQFGSIAKANKGSGVLATWEIPIPGLAIGIHRFRAIGKFNDLIGDFYEGTFSDLWVDVSDEPRDATETEDGWRRIVVDLNRGAHGKYLYFILKPDSSDLISDITFGGDRKRENIATPAGYTKCDVDLNLGCGKNTDYIYTFWMRDSAHPVKGVGVVAGSDRELPIPDGYTKIDFDLNRGARGNFIYCCVRR